MEISPAIADLLCSYDRTVSETARLCYKARHGQDEESHDQTLESIFQDSLQLKSRLTELEDPDDHPPGWALLASLINCEYQLYRANKVPIRYNPWLSHWVEVVQSWQTESKPPQSHPEDATAADGLRHIFGTRVEFVKALISSSSAEKLERMSPLEIFHYFEKEPIESFDINRYVRMLQEEGIYESPTSTKTAQGGAEVATEATQRKRNANADMFMHELETDPAAALSQLKALPVDLQSLELINVLLFSGALDNYDPPSLLRDYIQHALRFVEHVGLEGLDSEDSWTVSPASNRKEDQERLIKLLILFMRNLLARRVVTPQTFYFEIQEICIRFIWVKEVRDFRSDLEVGVL